MAEIESCAYEEGYSEEKFMEKAGHGIAVYVKAFCKNNRLVPKVTLLCGKGNNGGDAYVAGRYLLADGFDVSAFQIGSLEQCSTLSQTNRIRFETSGGDVTIAAYHEEVSFGKEGVIIDGLFGTGLKSSPRQPYSSVIEKANKSGLPIIAIDIPSGLNGDTGEAEGSVIKAVATLFLGLPKVGFFLCDGWNHVGKLHYVDFGLPQKQIDSALETMLAPSAEDFIALMPPLKANRHKYQAGYVVGVAGSPGMPGAANLCAAGALRGGAGIVRLLHPKGMEAAFSSSMYELIKTPYEIQHLQKTVELLNKATACFIGPGLGLDAISVNLLRVLIPNIHMPVVIDADALNVLAQEEIPLPKKVVMTPHLGEMRRLLHSVDSDFLNEDFIQSCQNYAEQKDVTLLLKGGPSFIFHPHKPIIVIPFGDPGMATAGSGDVLTGLIAALLSQGLSTHEAAIAGAFIHARAGELAAEAKTSYCMTATDIIDHFPQVFSLLPRYIT